MSIHIKEEKDVQQSQVKVFVRVRPLLISESKKQSLIEIENDQIKICDTIVTQYQKFDRVFDTNCKQEDIFKPLQPYVQKCFQGYNMTVFAYGQTNSGKTYTMFGSDWEILINNKKPSQKYQNTFYEDIETDIEFAGIIPRSIHEAYNFQKQSEKQYRILISFIQIYNEKIYDLFQTGNFQQHLEIHENQIDGTYIKDLQELECQNYNDCLQMLKKGEKKRIVRETSYNTKSSRSHSIFQISIVSMQPDKYGNIQKAKLNLCDLAGSEKINKSEKISIDHMNELKNINKSLTTLGQCINCLTIKNQKLPPPFRESKLTRLLQDSLGGNAQTFIITNISENQIYIDDTKNTLKFAENASHIVLKIKANEINSNDQNAVQRLRNEIIYLKNILSMRNKSINIKENVMEKLKQLENENKKLKAINVSPQEMQNIINENNQVRSMLKQIQNQQNIDTKDSLDTFIDKKLTSEKNNSTQISQASQYVSFRTNQKSNPQIKNQQSQQNLKIQQSQQNLKIQQNQQNKKTFINHQQDQKKKAIERLQQLDKLQIQNQSQLDAQLDQISKKQNFEQKSILSMKSKIDPHQTSSNSLLSVQNSKKTPILNDYIHTSKINKIQNMYLK